MNRRRGVGRSDPRRPPVGCWLPAVGSIGLHRGPVVVGSHEGGQGGLPPQGVYF